MKIFKDPEKMRAWARKMLLAKRKIALVPTMGYLHDGHISLVDRAKAKGADEIVVSIFVNPVQFGPNEDYEKYPRNEKADLAKCRAAGVSAVFLPSAQSMYHADRSAFVDEGTLSKGLCGAKRPGHFRGVCTVVAKLFNIVQPDFAVFGEKDFQQAAVIKRMVRDLNFGVKIVLSPIVREKSGLAMSSRNTYLSAEEKQQALTLSRVLFSVREGEIKTPASVAAKLKKAGLVVDYVECVDSETLAPLKRFKPLSRVLVAVYDGKTRLIDNVEVKNLKQNKEKKMNKKVLAAISMVIAATCAFGAGGVSSLKSPDGRNEIRFDSESISYEVLRDGVLLTAKTPIDMKISGKSLSSGAAFKGFVKGSLSGTVGTPVYKKSSVDLSANTLYADYGDWGVRLAARNDGVAYRFETKFAGKVRVDSESSPLIFPNAKVRTWCAITPAAGCEETVPFAEEAGKIETKEKIAVLPLVYTEGGKYVAVVESDVYDYPVWNLSKEKLGSSDFVCFEPWFARWPKTSRYIGGWGKEVLKKGGRWVRVTSYENYLVDTDGTRTFPWRGFVLADKPAAFVESDLVYALARPRAAGDDFAWVRPGKVAWDWWNCFDNRRIPENNGVNTKTYERFIDFARKNGVEYVILDEGWSESLNIWKYHPSVDVPHIIRYANERGVGIILWMAWAQAFGDEERVVSHFAKLGVKGFKVDFMDRGDAEVERFLWKFAEECRKHRMLVDYHGVHRPTGMSRAYPNVLNYEGVHGLEQMKWGALDARHFVDCDVRNVFLRMTAGPMDYTPGAMDNYPVDAYKGGSHGFKEGKGSMPGSPGSRSHQMALMALYEAPLQMLCDAPTKYEKNLESFRFMAATPVVWADSIGLAGCPDSMAAVARRSFDGSWYVAAITDSKARDWTLDTSAFLKDGEWTAEIFRDAPTSEKSPVDYIHEFKTVKSGDKIDFHMIRGGGCVVKFVRK